MPLKKKEVADVNVYVNDGRICYDVPQKAVLCVYNTAAAIVSKVAVDGKGILTTQLSKGAYIVSVMMKKKVEVFRLFL